MACYCGRDTANCCQAGHVEALRQRAEAAERHARRWKALAKLLWPVGTSEATRRLVRERDEADDRAEVAERDRAHVIADRDNCVLELEKRLIAAVAALSAAEPFTRVFSVDCQGCRIEAEIGTEENPHPVPSRFHTCKGTT